MNREATWAYNHDTAFLQIVSEISHLPCAFWSEDLFWSSLGEGKHPLETDPAMKETLFQACPADTPALYLEGEFTVWGIMRLGRFTVAVGPAVFTTSGQDDSPRYARGHNLREPLDLKKTSLREMGNYLSLLACHFTGSPVKLENMVRVGDAAKQLSWEYRGDLFAYHLDQSESDHSHSAGVAFETEVAEAVREGDVERVRALVNSSSVDMSQFGSLAGEERKNEEYMMVALLTILTRAAKEGGLPSEKAHEVGDICLRRMDEAVRRGDPISGISMKAMEEFAVLVREARETRSRASHVEACKDYIEDNLMKGIEVGQIAPALGLSRTYLSHLFRKEEGITIQMYIQREKCRKGEQFLKYTDWSIAQISEYLGFSTPAYFSTCFRQVIGETPAQYRKTHARK